MHTTNSTDARHTAADSDADTLALTCTHARASCAAWQHCEYMLRVWYTMRLIALRAERANAATNARTTNARPDTLRAGCACGGVFAISGVIAKTDSDDLWHIVVWVHACANAAFDGTHVHGRATEHRCCSHRCVPCASVDCMLLR
jgi:hypothetical protein